MSDNFNKFCGVLILLLLGLSTLFTLRASAEEYTPPAEDSTQTVTDSEETHEVVQVQGVQTYDPTLYEKLDTLQESLNTLIDIMTPVETGTEDAQSGELAQDYKKQRRRLMKLQILVSSLNQEVKSLAEKMNLQADTILINQCNENRYEEWTQDGHQIRCYHLAERGVGLSRNNALLRADADLCLFSDEDIVYDDGAVERIIEGFEQHPEADMLLFNVRVQESRFTYWNSFYKRVRWYNCGRYPAYSFALRTAKMHEKNLTYSLLFGGGAKYANGEDSLFIHDCLKAGLKVYSIPVEIGEEQPRPSTWFFGFDRKFFHDRGVLYHVLYGKLAAVMGFRFLLKNRSNMNSESCPDGLTFDEAKKALLSGIRDAKGGL